MGSNSSMYIGLSGLNSFSAALSVVSDNVANAGTNAFKSSSTLFGDMVAGYYSTQSEDTDREGAGSNILGVSTDFSQGAITNTDKWSDLAINGDGFFNVLAPSGEILYTRDGSFHVDKEGYLVNLQGYQVVSSDGSSIRVEENANEPAYMNYYIDTSGQVYGTPVAGGEPQTIGNPLRITTFANQDGLIRRGGNLFSRGPETGEPVDGTANAGRNGSVQDYSLESSNVDIAAQMVNMIIYQADYNANSKSISTASQMLETISNIVR